MLVGIALVRNEEDLVETTIRHHLAQGLDRILIADNDSTDATARLLEKLATSDRRILWSRTGNSGFHQAEAVTELAQAALKLGASWILPFDADEFWCAPGGLAHALRSRAEDAVSVPVVNFIQRREQTERQPRGVLQAVYRSDASFGDFRRARLGVEAGEFSYVEAPYQRKYIVRAVAGLQIGPGNHTLKGVGHKRSRRSPFLCLHLPLRAKDVFREKAAQAARLEAAGLPAWHGWQSHRFAKAVREGWVDTEWAANSQRDGMLDAARGKVKLTFDTRLRDMLASCVA
ncbi:Glycosyl transferase family 2 [Rhizobiales bacterium GAS113]|nr:Glycosyl transferase family 2 [Rhizobiales bacterium GAS113]SEE23191.1 Glycosyl transferase family 2 [Rhizobiales bacterium GAS188]